MSIMTIDPGTLEVTQVLESLDFEPACEDPGHDTDKLNHDDGPAKWWLTLTNPCGHDWQSMVCNKIRERGEAVKVMLAVHSPIVQCRRCDRKFSPLDMRLDFKPL